VDVAEDGIVAERLKEEEEEEEERPLEASGRRSCRKEDRGWL